jgi:hypothetical protein
VAVFRGKVATLFQSPFGGFEDVQPALIFIAGHIKRLIMLAWADTVLISGMLVVMFGFGLMVTATAGVSMWTQLHRRPSASHSATSRQHRIAKVVRSKFRDWTR